MVEQNGQLIRLGVGGLRGYGPGIAGFESWIVAFVIVLGLAWLAWLTMRPAGRARQSRPRGRAHGTGPGQPVAEPAGDDSTRANHTRKAP